MSTTSTISETFAGGVVGVNYARVVGAQSISNNISCTPQSSKALSGGIAGFSQTTSGQINNCVASMNNILGTNSTVISLVHFLFEINIFDISDFFCWGDHWLQ